MEKKIFDIILKDDNDGMLGVSLVNSPAIESNFVALEKIEDKQLFVASKEFKQVVTGALLIPDLLIFRKDQEGNPFYVRFSKDVIEQIALKFFKQKLIDKINLDHDQTKQQNDVFLFESVLISNEKQQEAYDSMGLGKLPLGTWIASFKVENKQLFQDIQSGKYKGFSIEAFLNLQPVEINQKEIKEYWSKKVLVNY